MQRPGRRHHMKAIKVKARKWIFLVYPLWLAMSSALTFPIHLQKQEDLVLAFWSYVFFIKILKDSIQGYNSKWSAASCSPFWGSWSGRQLQPLSCVLCREVPAAPAVVLWSPFPLSAAAPLCPHCPVAPQPATWAVLPVGCVLEFLLWMAGKS